MTAIVPITPEIMEWSKIFPKQMAENYSSSVTFMKQLTVVAISTITYLKDAFPDDCYSFEYFGGMKIRILKKKCSNDLAQFISTALMQAFDAFDKKYVLQLALCFYEGECTIENIIEYYIFEYTYNQAGPSMSVHSKTRGSGPTSTKYTFDNIRASTIQLIRTCVVITQTSTLKLPESCDVSLRLYYNEDAPEGYQAPGYTATDEDEDHIAGSLHEATSMGSVETPFHKLVLRSYMKGTVTASGEAIPSQNPPVMTQTGEELRSPPASAARSVSDNSETFTCVKCPCKQFDVDEVPMITCYYCNTQQHAECYGIRTANVDRVTRHCCTACFDIDPTRVITDHRLGNVSQRRREALCIYRRTLRLLAGRGAVRAAELARQFDMSDVSVFKLMKLMHNSGVVADPSSDLSTLIRINHEQLEIVMNTYFQTAQESIVDRLLAEEAFASQESTTDPIGDVLGPLTTINLHNASNLARIIDNPISKPATEDSTLKEYREALLSNHERDGKLPLNGSHNTVQGKENVAKKATGKRKVRDDEKPRLRSGVRTKRAKTKA